MHTNTISVLGPLLSRLSLLPRHHCRRRCLCDRLGIPTRLRSLQCTLGFRRRLLGCLSLGLLPIGGLPCSQCLVHLLDRHCHSCLSLGLLGLPPLLRTPRTSIGPNRDYSHPLRRIPCSQTLPLD